jgi:putative membrane protein
MKFLLRPGVAFVVNVLSLVAAAYFVTGFNMTQAPEEVLWIALVFTGLNFLVKPILKLLLGPLILLSFGLMLVFINMMMLYALDILSENLSIIGVPALLYGALIIGLVNFSFHFATKE